MRILQILCLMLVLLAPVPIEPEAQAQQEGDYGYVVCTSIIQTPLASPPVGYVDIELEEDAPLYYDGEAAADFAADSSHSSALGSDGYITAPGIGATYTLNGYFSLYPYFSEYEDGYLKYEDVLGFYGQPFDELQYAMVDGSGALQLRCPPRRSTLA